MKEYKAIYNDGKEEFGLLLDEKTYERIKITKAPGRESFNLLIVENVKDKVGRLINTEYITLT